MIVRMEELEKALAFLREINRVPLSEIVWTRNDVPVPIDSKDVEDWAFIGLQNSYFPQMNEAVSNQLTDDQMSKLFDSALDQAKERIRDMDDSIEQIVNGKHGKK